MESNKQLEDYQKQAIKNLQDGIEKYMTILYTEDPLPQIRGYAAMDLAKVMLNHLSGNDAKQISIALNGLADIISIW